MNGYKDNIPSDYFNDFLWKHHTGKLLDQVEKGLVILKSSWEHAWFNKCVWSVQSVG